MGAVLDSSRRLSNGSVEHKLPCHGTLVVGHDTLPAPWPGARRVGRGFRAVVAPNGPYLWPSLRSTTPSAILPPPSLIILTPPPPPLPPPPPPPLILHLFHHVRGECFCFLREALFLCFVTRWRGSIVDWMLIASLLVRACVHWSCPCPCGVITG